MPFFVKTIDDVVESSMWREQHKFLWIALGHSLKQFNSQPEALSQSGSIANVPLKENAPLYLPGTAD
jgi:hypothetical protein